MDRRKSIKTLVVGTLATGVLVEACQPDGKKLPDQTKPAAADDAAIRMPEEMIVDKNLREEKFFNEGELATITLLADIIIPRDEVSGSASDAKVTEFIEFMVNDKPEFRTPLRGGLRWLDMYCLNQFGKQFRDLDEKQQLNVVDEIAYPEKAKPEFRQGVAFFTLVRNLTMSGFYTTEIGVKDIGFMGNRPNQWNGVPEDVLKQHQLAYSEKELKECISFEKTT
jgi:hypothetical protein